MTILPAQFVADAISELLSDWAGQDELFFHDAALVTIMRHVGKVRSYLAWEGRAEIRTHQKEFREQFCQAAGIKERRLQEGIAAYKRDFKQGDNVLETSQRIFQLRGNWSKALPAKPEKEPVTETCGHCPIHCNHE